MTEVYQQWQARIAYYHFKRRHEEHNRRSGCVGGFTRLLSTAGAQNDSIMAEMPTLVVSLLRPGGACNECDHGFVVMNRPFAMRQFFRSSYYAALPEQYLFIMEPDHLLLHLPVNSATQTRPVAFGFYYMTVKYDPPKLRPVIEKFFPNATAVQPVGPSPLLVYRPQMEAMLPSWWRLCLTLKRDADADRAFGWVLEMWGYAINAARLGMHHQILETFQAEPAGVGIEHEERFDLYHYTFDLDDGHSWRFSKRDYISNYPPRLAMPPAAMGHSSRTFVQMINTAIDEIEDWPASKPESVSSFCSAVKGTRQCIGWARSGECIRNPGYMLRSCKAACDDCKHQARRYEVG
eukprot:CAMPEP_0119305838 /NCGR_PEP_ID=MMETSP1333-20130426/6737_1 /TAXON_ID=418940 /ORGANISM="Scyphosphaera apsteinii, Strain RCC1455" /LENGTH=348 /DNA_ID=CAMNT_0007309019 /DNA_START=186 /DNA_END=1232 /DNA_ORIENTATION=+